MLSPDLTTALSIALLVFAGWPGSAGRGRWIGRLVILLLLSPGLRYFSALFTFPIRLQLSDWAGSLLRLAGLNVQAEGNVLIKNGVEIAVDPACMGLQLTGVSLLWAFFALIWQERQAQKAVPVKWVVVFGFLTFSLTIGANLSRIVLLVAFDAMPNTLAHEVIGLICVAIYAWLPAWVLARQLVNTLGQPDQKANTQVVAKSVSLGIGLLVIGLGIMAFTSRPVEAVINRHQQRQILATVHVEHRTGCRYKALANGFVQLGKPGVLIYLKPQPDWFSADHSPMACWRGSGYELRRVRETVLDGHPAYVGELRKKGNVLYTAWWFSNGATTTISQFTLRTQMLRGETGFALVNVTIDTEKIPFVFNRKNG